MAIQKNYKIPEPILTYLANLGYTTSNKPMEPFINNWYHWLKATGDFYDYNKYDTATSRRYKYHRLSAKPANRVVKEWASLLLNEDVTITTDNEASNKWIEGYLQSIDFYSQGQNLISRAFALGTGAWALWLKFDNETKMYIRRYDARMIIPLSYDDDGITECAFVTQATLKGKAIDQLQIHMLDGGTYHIKTVLFDKHKEIHDDSINADFDTTCPTPTFSIVKPAIDNTVVDLSPYGQSIYHDAIDAIQMVDLCFDAMGNEVKLSKMRIFVGDMLLDTRDSGGKPIVMPFGEDDVVFRKVASNQDSLIDIFAPPLRIGSQEKAYNRAWQTLGDNVGFGKDYFSADKSGIRTATEVSSDNADLMRNIKKHENALGASIAKIIKAVIWVGNKHLGAPVAEVNSLDVQFDDSIIQDTASEKAQDLMELDRTLNAWEYRKKWYGETEAKAKANVPQGITENITVPED
jgi:A118 family predicted phage portal protein